MTNAEPTLHVFEPDGGVPNSRLPLAFWPGRLPADARNGPAANALFRKNGWQGTWVYTVFPFWHFHTRGRRRRLDSSPDFLMAGGYPPDQEGNIIRIGDLDDGTIAGEIAALALPETDPISGQADGVVAAWRKAKR